MKTPRGLAGAELADCLCRRWGYHKVHQEGSHIVLQTSDPSPHKIAVRAVARHKGIPENTTNTL